MLLGHFHRIARMKNKNETEYRVVFLIQQLLIFMLILVPFFSPQGVSAFKQKLHSCWCEQVLMFIMKMQEEQTTEIYWLIMNERFILRDLTLCP